MEPGGDEELKKKERSFQEIPHSPQKTCIFSKRVNEILFAIVVTVAAAFSVKAIEMVVTNARETLTSSELVYAG